MQLKLFYDAEYFHFIRDFVSQFKNTISSGSQGEQSANPLYFSKSDSEAHVQKRLVELTEQFKAEQGGDAVDYDKYIEAYSAI